jgi:SAM-dependent methyltransferase
MPWLSRHFRRLDDRYQGPEGDAFALEELAPVARRFLPAGGRVLEVGCGYGRNLVALAALPAGLVAGSDPSLEELVRAAKRAAALPGPQRGRVALVRQELFRLPFADASFDLVVLWQVLEHVFGREQKLRVLAESARVLRSGGHLLVETPNQWFPFDYHDNQLPLVHWTGSRRLREWLTWRVRGMRYHPSEYLGLPALERLLRRACPGARFTRATRVYFAASYAEAWRELGGTQVALKRVLFAALAPVHALLTPFGGSADLFLPSLRVVWRVEKGK